MNVASVFGLAGAITASALFYPQVWSAYKTKRTRDLSWLTIIIALVNGAVWLTYGALKADPFIYVTNAFASIATLALAFLKHRYDPMEDVVEVAEQGSESGH